MINIPNFHHLRVNSYPIFILIIILGIITPSLAITDNPTGSKIEDPLLNILTTIAVPYDIIRSITGVDANVESIVDSSTDVHSFEGPTIQQIQNMLDSDVIFSLGVSGSEPWLENIVQDNPSLNEKIIPLGNLTEDGYEDPLLDNEINPHIWMNPNVVKKMVNKATFSLIELDPVHSTEFSANNITFQEKLTNLLIDIESNKTAYFDGLKVVVSHPAYYYLFDLLGIERLATIEDHSGGEPGQSTIVEIINLMKEENCTLIVTSPQHSDEDALEIARSAGAKITELSAIPGIYENFQVVDYISMIEHCMIALRNPGDVEPDNNINGFVSWGIYALIGLSSIALIFLSKGKIDAF
ncbi:metal ABC transporter substrate-binding protein [Promethearchaeum syntrophicum]|uniref:Metal ABC transporter substrate-binding protein n=1 Tax=Promethearchaeum syntrophicum TaxID=2594042 RepID=A0A5B9D7J1_9ARCH|nr:metal ABC transporter substrate-binding protein [Candidatus Prometheoarchaeum syntrophicum]